MQAILGTEAIAIWYGILIALVGVAFLAVVEIEKQIRLGLRPAPAAPHESA